MVFSDSKFLIGSPPTSRALAPPFPSGPWHTAHFAVYTRAPSTGVPPPGGRPVPSGRILMSQSERSAALIGFPSFGACANNALARRTSGTTMSNAGNLRVDIPDLPAALDGPALDGVVVLTCECSNSRDFRRLAAGGYKFGSGRLHVPGLVPRAALQKRGTAIPTPWQAESSRCLAMHRRLQRGLRPAPATVRRDHNFGDASIAGIGNARNFIEARTAQCQARRGMRDKRFHFLDEIESIRLPIRQNRSVGPGFVKCHPRLVGDLDPAHPLDVHVAFPTRQEQPHRIAVSRHDSFAVLIESNHGVVKGLR